LPPEQAVSTPSAINAVRASMYDRLHAFGYATSYFLGPSALADDLVNRTGATRFAGLVRNDQNSGMSTYNLAYDLINDANLLINNIPEGVLDDATLAQYRGEALMMRAFAMHHLTRAIGYEPGMTPATGPGAGFELGIVIRTMPTLDASDASFRPRKTVGVVYDRIIADLEDSISLLSSGDAGTPTFITQAASQALMARVQLYAQNYDQANNYAADALSNTSARLAQPGEVATMFDETTGLNPEAIFVITTDPNTESLGINNSLTVYTAQQYVALIPTQDLMDMYDSGDARLALYNPCFDETDGSFETGCFATHPDIPLPAGATGLEISKWAGELGQQADNYPFFRVSEMLLIQAEARLTTGGDVAAPLNQLRTARNLGMVSGVTLEDVLDEKRREFAAEGQRFFDLKRLGRTIRKAPETLNTVINNVPYTDYKVIDNISYNEVALSEDNAPADSVLIQNPVY
jgi:phenylpyruvate tautomerase PptA (4-oxalocrotonate tautomerase family)